MRRCWGEVHNPRNRGLESVHFDFLGRLIGDGIS